MRFKDGEAGQPSHTTTLIEIPASLGQALDTQERTAQPLALGCCAAQAARHDMEPHGHASAQASPPLQLGSARQALISVAQCCSPHVHFAGQAVLLQSGSAACTLCWASRLATIGQCCGCKGLGHNWRYCHAPGFLWASFGHAREDSETFGTGVFCCASSKA